MARLAGVDIPREKRVEVALTYIYGVGRTRASQTLTETGISPDTRVKDLSDAELVQEDAPALPVGGERLALATRAVEGQHQLGA